MKQDPEQAKLESELQDNFINSEIIPEIFTFSSEASGFQGDKILNEEIKPSRIDVTNNGGDRNSLNQTKIIKNIHHSGDRNSTKNAKILSSEFFSHLTKKSRESKVL